MFDGGRGLGRGFVTPGPKPARRPWLMTGMLVTVKTIIADEVFRVLQYLLAQLP